MQKNLMIKNLQAEILKLDKKPFTLKFEIAPYL